VIHSQLPGCHTSRVAHCQLPAASQQFEKDELARV